MIVSTTITSPIHPYGSLSNHNKFLDPAVHTRSKVPHSGDFKFTNNSSVVQEQVLIGTHEKTPTAAETLAIAVISQAFPQSAITRSSDESIKNKWIQNENILTIGLVEQTDSARRNIGRYSAKERQGVAYSPASMAWYSFGMFCLDRLDIVGPLTKDIFDAVDHELFLPVDRYDASSWLWSILFNWRARSVHKKLKNSYMGTDDMCYSHILHAAKIILRQTINTVCERIGKQLEKKGYTPREDQPRSMLFGQIEGVQHIGKVSYSPPEKNSLTGQVNPELAEEIANIVAKRFSKKK